jgi:ABC-type cobalamin/Fe3+-siderophores transport system ATPase subunit
MSHSIVLIFYADNLFFFKEGELIIQGRPRVIHTENVIERIFNVKTRVIENPVTNKSLVVYS